jgi:ASC-1-like (ASCH) protein
MYDPGFQHVLCRGCCIDGEIAGEFQIYLSQSEKVWFVIDIKNMIHVLHLIIP